MLKNEPNLLYVFLRARNIHLIKETGMIPFYFKEMFNFNSSILTYQNDDSYPYLDRYCKGVELIFIKRGILGVLKYLFLHSRKIQILVLLHGHIYNLLYGIFYKLMHKNGYLYLKMDKRIEFKKENLYTYIKFGSNVFSRFFGRIINLLFLKIVNLISFESKELVNHFCKKHSKLKKKLFYIPNGVNDFYINNNMKDLNFDEKDNTILTVGRIGAKEKSNELLFEAISKIMDLKNWKILLIGPIEKSFEVYIDQFFKSHPHLKEKIFLIGEIKNRKKLYEYYQKSKIFCLTSIVESFGIVLVEAGFFGNFIVSSDLPSARDITNNGKLGRLFSIGDSSELALILERLINNEDILKNNYKKIKKFIDENFCWSVIIDRLYLKIKDIL